jgi:hypothetical protein
MAAIQLSPINISRVLLEMGEEKHAVSDSKYMLLLSGFKQNIYTSKKFLKTILFKISSTFFELLSRCLMYMDGWTDR